MRTAVNKQFPETKVGVPVKVTTAFNQVVLFVDRSWHEENSEYKIYGHTSDYTTIKNTVPELKTNRENNPTTIQTKITIYTFHLNDTFLHYNTK